MPRESDAQESATTRDGAEPRTSRRALLGAAGTVAAGGLLPPPFQTRSDPGFVVRQGDRCVPVTPLRGSEPVEALYGYRKAETRYSAAGPTGLQRADGSVLFLYRGPQGIGLVAIHGKLDGDGDGGSVSFAIDGLPAGGEWVVRDDSYPGDSNHDRWRLGPGSAEVDWTWAGGRTDGAAFRGVAGPAAITVDPAFNRAAALFGEFYDGRVETWEFLSGEMANPDRIDLRMDRPVTVETGDCGDGTTTPATTRRPTTTRTRTTRRTTTTQPSTTTEDGGDGEDDEREDDGDDDAENERADRREEAHEDRAETFEARAERAREKAEREAERFEEKAENRNGKATEKFERKAERARRKGERKARRFERKAERARRKANRSDGGDDEREGDDDDEREEDDEEDGDDEREEDDEEDDEEGGDDGDREESGDREDDEDAENDD